MKALTLRHPWPWAILRLGKRIENRTWRPYQLPIGGWFAIHGGLAPRHDFVLAGIADLGRDLLTQFGVPAGVDDVKLGDVIIPGIVALVRFGGVVTQSKDPWFEGPIGWLLTEVTPLPEPVPCRGAQGLWDVPPEIERKLLTTLPPSL